MKVREGLRRLGLPLQERASSGYVDFFGPVSTKRNAFFDRYMLRLSLSDDRLFSRIAFAGYVPADNRIATLVMLSLVVSDWVFGNVKMNIRTGEIAYESAIPATALCDDVDVELHRLVLRPVTTLALLSRPLAEVMLSAKSPAEAYSDWRKLEEAAEADDEMSDDDYTLCCGYEYNVD